MNAPPLGSQYVFFGFGWDCCSLLGRRGTLGVFGVFLFSERGVAGGLQESVQYTLDVKKKNTKATLQIVHGKTENISMIHGHAKRCGHRYASVKPHFKLTERHAMSEKKKEEWR